MFYRCNMYHLWFSIIHRFVFGQVILPSPVLNEGELESLLKDLHLRPHVLPTFFDVGKGVDGSLKRSLDKLCEAADEAVRNGSQLLVLSDRSDELVCSLLAIFVLLICLLVPLVVALCA